MFSDVLSLCSRGRHTVEDVLQLLREVDVVAQLKALIFAYKQVRRNPREARRVLEGRIYDLLEELMEME